MLARWPGVLTSTCAAAPLRQWRRCCSDGVVVAKSRGSLGDVFLVIDGWATLRQEFDFLEGPITAIAAQGLSFGIQSSLRHRAGPSAARIEGSDRDTHRAPAR